MLDYTHFDTYGNQGKSEFILKKEMNKNATILSVLGCILVTSSIGIFVNTYRLTEFNINLMIMRTAYGTNQLEIFSIHYILKF